MTPIFAFFPHCGAWSQAKNIGLLQGQTLIETKNRTRINNGTTRLSDVKTAAVLMVDWVFSLFFRPHPWEFDSSRVSASGNLLSKAKKYVKCPGVSLRERRGRGGLGAAGID